MNPTDIATPAIVVTLALGVMQVLKYADPTNQFQRFYPLASLLIGGVLCYLFHFTLLVGLTTSLAVAGTYDTIAYTIVGKKS